MHSEHASMNTIAEGAYSCSTWDGYTFDPGTYIRTVNKLMVLPKSDLLVGLREYRDVLGPPSGDRLMNSTKIFLLLRLLLVPDDPQRPFPTIQIGRPDDINEPPFDDWPLYPLSLVNNIPLLFVPGFVLAGDPEDPLAHIEFCEQHCHLRTAALHPPDDPLDSANALVQSKEWYRPATSRERDLALLRAQLLRLVNPVLSVPDVNKDDFFVQLQKPGVWEKYCESFRQLNVAWDVNEDRYVLAKANLET